MVTNAFVGYSRAISSVEAGRDAALTACGGLPSGAPALGLVFATARHDQPAMLGAVRDVLGPDALIAGCSGEGVIAGAHSEEADRGVTVLAVASDTIRFERYAIAGYSEDSSGAGRTLANVLLRAGLEDACGLIVFADGISGNCAAFLAELHAALPKLPIVGGTSADALEFVRTYQYDGVEVMSGGVVAVLIRGDATLRIAVSHGCAPLGLPRRITRANGGWVEEIDGRPAWNVLKEYLDGDPQDLNADGIVHLCLGEELPPDEGGYVIHTPLQLDRERGALFFPGGGLPAGREVQLTRRDPDRIVEGAQRCGRLLSMDAGRPAFVLQLDCAGRGRVLFGSCASDYIVRPIQEQLPSGTPWIGFHTYGEIASVCPGAPPRYHNYTVALCGVYERTSR